MRNIDQKYFDTLNHLGMTHKCDICA